MKEIDVSHLLQEMRAMAAQTGAAVGPPERVGVGRPSFAELLEQSIDKVNEVQQDAAELARAFETGDKNVDLTEVMITLQKASLSFRAMTEVRNQLIDAYQEIMNMPI